MKQVSWLNKNYPAPKLGEILQLAMCILLPNVIFLAVAFYTVTSRPLMNIDYLVALLFLLLPWKVCRIVGGRSIYCSNVI